MVGVEDNRRDLDFKVHEQFFADIRRKCENPGEDISKKWPGAAPPISGGVCKAMPACLKLWEQNFEAIDFRYSTDQPYVDHTAKAIEFDEAGDMTSAVQSFRAAARFLPHTSEVWANLATALDSMPRDQDDAAVARVNAEIEECNRKAADIEGNGEMPPEEEL